MTIIIPQNNNDNQVTQPKPLIINETSTKLSEKLGEGAYGLVYKSVLNDTEVAVKLTSKAETNLGIVSIIEIDIMSRLRHDNVMPLMKTELLRIYMSNTLNKCKSSEYFAITMPLAKCEILKYIEKNSAPLSLRLSFIDQVACGLEFLHINNILHLDLKSDNILVMADSSKIEGVKAIISDFGLAIHINETGYRSHNIVSIVDTYRPPEAFKESLYSAKSDVWSYGIIAIYILIGHKIFFRDNRFNIYNQIMKLFGPEERRTTLINVFRKMSVNSDEVSVNNLCTFQNMLVDFFDHILDVNPGKRYNMTQVIQDPLLSYNYCPIGHSLIPNVLRINHHILHFYKGMDWLIRKCFAIDISTETIFLTLDLFHRMFHQISTNKLEWTHSNWIDLLLTGMTCLWIAHKMIENTRIPGNLIVKLSDNIIVLDQLLDKEIFIVQTLKGIIYRRNLYNISSCKHDLVSSFEKLTNVYLYPNIDMHNYTYPPCSYCKNCSNTRSLNSKEFAETFVSYFPKTEYYKWFHGIYKAKDNYVEHLHNFDKNNTKLK
jgi:hypothetical protein